MLIEHPKKAATAVANPDGSRYGDYKMELSDWDIVRESLYILDITTNAIDLMQTTSSPTAGLVLPVVAGLISKLDLRKTKVKYGGVTRRLERPEVIAARKLLVEALET
eukprot:gene32205-40754_t